MTSAQQIDLWLSAPSEHRQLEFKEAKTQYDNRKLARYCVAIANEGGGHLVLGVTDAKPRKVVGSSAFNDPVEMASKLFQAVGFRVDIEEVAHPDGRVVVFHIPSRPAGTAYSHDGTYWMRIGEELKLYVYIYIYIYPLPNNGTVQCLKYELHHNNALIRLLMRRALSNPYQIGHFLYWHLIGEFGDKIEANLHHLERFGLYLEEYLLFIIKKK